MTYRAWPFLTLLACEPSAGTASGPIQQASTDEDAATTLEDDSAGGHGSTGTTVGSTPTPRLIARMWYGELVTDGVTLTPAAMGYDWVAVDAFPEWESVCRALAPWTLIESWPGACSGCDYQFQASVGTVETLEGDACSQFDTDAFEMAGTAGFWDMDVLPDDGAGDHYQVRYTPGYPAPVVTLTYNSDAYTFIYWDGEVLKFRAGALDSLPGSYYIE